MPIFFSNRLGKSNPNGVVANDEAVNYFKISFTTRASTT